MIRPGSVRLFRGLTTCPVRVLYASAGYPGLWTVRALDERGGVFTASEADLGEW